MKKERETLEILIANGIDKNYAKDIVLRACLSAMDDSEDIDYMDEVRKLMIRDLGDSVSSGLEILFFVGPTGSGKTTTVAKMASWLSLTVESSVGIIAADAYRAAATEQIEAFTKIMDKPCIEINDMSPAQFISDHPGMKQVLVDTQAYTSRENWSDYFTKLYDSFQNYKRKIIMVLPATGRLHNLKNMIDYFKHNDEVSLLFTKLDETDIYGEIYNIQKYSGKPISYVSFGQDVLSDFGPFKLHKWANALKMQ